MSDTDLAFQVSDVTLSRIILGYLREHGQYDAMVALQLSSGVAENDMGQELLFLQQLTLEGRWEDVLGYVAPLKRYLTRYEQVKSTQTFIIPRTMLILYTSILFHL
jgi:hypothetical protein